MKKLILSLFAFGILSTGISQAVSDRTTVPIAVNLNQVLRLKVINGGKLECTFYTIDQYKTGISGDNVTSATPNGGAASASAAFYKTQFTVSSSTNWFLEFGAEDGELRGVDDETNTLALNNVGYSLSSTVDANAGAHTFVGSVAGADAVLVSAPTTDGTVVAALAQFPTTLIAAAAVAGGGAGTQSNAGDPTDNSFEIIWRVGTSEVAGMNQTKLIDVGAKPDRYVTNVFFDLQMEP